jgi:hypothetical protein
MFQTKFHFYLFFLVSTTCFSQEKADADITDVTKITFFNPGFSYEGRIGKFQSLYAQAFMNTSAYFSYSDYFGTNAGIYFDPALTLQYRYYYNYNKRDAKSKRTEMNSLNYLSVIALSILSKSGISSSAVDENHRRPVTTIGIVWGFQRNYPKRFSLDLNLGVGYLFGKETVLDDTGQYITRNRGQFTTTSQFNLGFWLNKRK